MKEFFFCYDRQLSNYIRVSRGIRCITAAIHPSTGNMFWLFKQTPELGEAIRAFKQA